MSILGIDIVKKLGLIENLSDEEIKRQEGCGFDVRIGKVFEMGEGEGFLFLDTRKTPDYRLIGEHKDDGENRKVILEPGKIYAGETIERFNMPKNVLGRFYPRHVLYKNGILVLGQRTDPGYRGSFTFVMINLSGKRFELEIGSRIAHFIFYEIRGETSSYKGQWQGGRVFIEKEEKQV